MATLSMLLTAVRCMSDAEHPLGCHDSWHRIHGSQEDGQGLGFTLSRLLAQANKLTKKQQAGERSTCCDVWVKFSAQKKMQMGCKPLYGKSCHFLVLIKRWKAINHGHRLWFNVLALALLVQHFHEVSIPSMDVQLGTAELI
eukprot:161036-Pelagomonas_calceolata.AAC.7